jgi:protein SCO1/2
MNEQAIPTFNVRPSSRFIDWLTGAIVLMAVGIFAFNLVQPITVLPRLAPAPGYRLLDQAGNSMDSELQRGKLTLYSFAALGCAACEQTLAQIAETVGGLDETVTPITLILDSPLQLPSADWTLLTGSPAAMKAIVGGGFDLYFADDGQFAPRWVLVDAAGQMRARYHTAQPDPTILQRDVDLLLTEMAQSQGIGRFGYEAAHLFACYPK